MADDNNFDPWSTPQPPKKKPKSEPPGKAKKSEQELDDALKKFRRNTKAMFASKNNRPLLPILIAFLALWLIFGSVFFVGEGEKVVIMRLGKFQRDAAPGINFKLPPPFEKEYPLCAECCALGGKDSGKPSAAESPDRV